MTARHPLSAGRAAELLVQAHAMMGSAYRLTAYEPVADDDHIDAFRTPRHRAWRRTIGGMERRIDYSKVVPAAFRAYLEVGPNAHPDTLEEKLLELVKIRASQINGCAFCLDMHVKDARAIGESEERLALVAAWREAPGFSERERAALAWTEALTLLPERGAPDELFDALRACFSDEEIVALTWQVVVINGWNRMAVSMRTPAGQYVSRRAPTAAAAT